MSGSVEILRDLGLLDPDEEVAAPEVTAVAVNALAVARLPALTEAEAAEMARLALPALFTAWGGVGGRQVRPYAADIELTRLGLLAQHAKVVATVRHGCGPRATRRRPAAVSGPRL